MLFCALNRKFFFIQEMLDLQNQLNISFPIQSLSRRRPFGVNLFELRFPKSKDIGRNTDEGTDFSDFEVEFVWQFFLKRWGVLHLEVAGFVNDRKTNRFSRVSG